VRGVLALAGVALLLAAAGEAPAAEQEPAGGAESQYGYALAHELMSPFCPGRTLAACPSDKAAELRQWILLQEAAGATREEVVTALEARYGEVIRSSPEAEGWGLAAWLLPGVALLVGALGVWAMLRRMTRGGHAEANDGTAARVTPLRTRPDAPPGSAAQATTPATAPATAPSTAPSADADPDEAELERLVDAELAASER
jgi:cytochrome c-type biogenesis protein CcmH